jgi:cation-transporting ATPase I
MLLSLRAPTLPNPLALTRRVLSPLNPSRRVWSGDGLALVQVRGLDGSTGVETGQAVTERVEALPGVAWAEAQHGTGRVGIAYDPEQVALDDLVAGVAVAEIEVGTEREPFAEAEHPADAAPLQRAVTALAADAAGLGLTAFTRLARLSPLPLEAATLVSLVDNTPFLRRTVERAVGAPFTEVALAVSSAVTQGLAQGPSALLIDAAHRTQQIGEVRARQRVWSQCASELSGPGRDGAIPDLDERPGPLPDGPIETHTARVVPAAVAGAAAVLAATRDPRAATNVVLAGVPKAARLGRESFAAHLGQVLAARGVVPLDGDVLRRLDRIDTVLIDARVLQDGDEVGQVVALGGADTDRLRQEAQVLLELPETGGVRREGGAALGGVDDLGLALPRGGKTRLRELRRGRTTVLALAVGGDVRGLVTVAPRPDPAGTALLAALDTTGLHVEVVERRLATAVRDAQREGAGVAVVSAVDQRALAAADCGIGIVSRPAARAAEPGHDPVDASGPAAGAAEPGHDPVDGSGPAAGAAEPGHDPEDGSGGTPWAADLLGSVEDAAFVLSACTVAREVSRRSASLALGGSGLGTFMALMGPTRSASSRISLVVSGAAAASMANGTFVAATHARRFVPVQVDQTPWHTLAPAVALRRLDSTPQGLAESEADRRANGHAADSGWPARLLPFAEELTNPLTPVLALGAGLSAAAGSMVDAGIVTTLIGLNALVGGIQRLRTERDIAALLEATSGSIRVRRDDVEHDLPASELVVGDIVRYQRGDVVAGDARILSASLLEVDESTLTGESLPVAKRPDPTPDLPVADRSCMLYDGTTVSAGEALAVVVATGPATEAGRSLAVADVEPPPSGVERRLARLTARTVPIALGAGAAVSAAGLLRQWRTSELIGSGVSLAVASVPEGLPFVANVAQMAAARRLASRNALVRNPRALEALGRVDTLCFDKTGTLTKGRIKLRQVSDGATTADIGELTGTLRAVLTTALRANPEDRLDNETDRAVAKGAGRAGVQTGWSRIAELPFDPSRGFLAVLGDTGDQHRLAVKGAPEAVLPRCVTWRGEPLDDEDTAALEAEVEQRAATGARVLAVAERGASDRTELDEDRLHDLEFLGFLAFSEEVRESAGLAVDEVRRAGVEVVMITGDHPQTAESIARELGILNAHPTPVLTGAQVDALDDDALAAALPGVTVFARVTPTQKVRIVRGLQRAGRTVAMTGDGANDAASIRLADCGIAVGKRSAPAARDAADIVVTTNRVETIVAAIVEGRAMWGSVREALAILVGGNLGEIGFSVAGSLLGGAPALNARQLLLVNLLTDLAPAVVIAVRPPRRVTSEALLHAGPDAALGGRLSRAIAVRAVTTGMGATGAYLLARVSGTPGRARTVALVALVGAQPGQTVLAGGGSKLVLVTGLLSAAALAGVVQTPVLSQFFGCRPLGPGGWATGAAAAGLSTAAAGVATAVLDRRALQPPPTARALASGG